MTLTGGSVLCCGAYTITCTSDQQTLTQPLSPDHETNVQASISSLSNNEVVGGSPPWKLAPATLPHQTPAEMLKRLKLLTTFTWATTSSAVLYQADLEAAVRALPDFSRILKQYRYYRTGWRLRIRINTNQFYFGALMVSWWPTTTLPGFFRANRAVLNPTIVSASLQESSDILIPYVFPQDWLFTDPTHENDQSRLYQSLQLCIEGLVPLSSTSTTAPDSVEVQVFVSMEDPEVNYNTNYELSPGGPPPVLHPKLATRQSVNVSKTIPGGKVQSTFSPPKDADRKALSPSKEPSFAEIAPTISSIPIIGSVVGGLYDIVKLGTRAVSGLLPAIGTLAPLAPLILDKPESIDEEMRVYQTPAGDQFASDCATICVPVKYSRRNYLSMDSNPAVRMGSWTLARYASIPGLAEHKIFAPNATVVNVPLVGSPTPLGYLQNRFHYWKGSVKVTLMFITSSFTSSRFAISLRPNRNVNIADPAYDPYIVRIVDVKGDTTVSFTIPWVSNTTWRLTNATDGPGNVMHITRITDMTTMDPSIDPYIHMLVWMSGGPDVQFSTPTQNSWTTPETFPIDNSAPSRRPVRKLKLHPELAEKQSGVHSTFAKPFEPIVDSCSYLVDNARVLGDSPVSFDDLLKRFYYQPSPHSTQDLYVTDDTTLGAWTAPFLARRGGYRTKFIAEDPSPMSVRLTRFGGSDLTTAVGESIPGSDGWQCLSIPQVNLLPFYWSQVPMGQAYELDPDKMTLQYLSFSDDLQLGFPTLPLTWTYPVTGLKTSKSATSPPQEGD